MTAEPEATSVDGLRDAVRAAVSAYATAMSNAQTYFSIGMAGRRLADAIETALAVTPPVDPAGPVDVAVKVAALHSELNGLLARVVDIHRELDAWGYLAPQNRSK